MASSLNKTVHSDRKTSAQVTCNVCKKYVNIKNTALCSICKKRYEFDCVGYPESTYRLKDIEARKKWKCKLCIKNQPDANSDATSNVTLRRKQHSSIKPSTPQQQISMQDIILTENTSQIPDTITKSLRQIYLPKTLSTLCRWMKT